ncbi:hypothetical protein XcvCFBP7111P_22005 [Xanthomonas citri pv. vignicola]|uniref:4-oxalomesaconate hydratase n=1 Tax=Xanthomonas citri pv. vignicola TaxID=473426 RepID=A0AB33CNI8_XANCI|nr:hypothetical protein XcvCFBP7111P_22005 [Xanthomonas citri pv. vignicola]
MTVLRRRLPPDRACIAGGDRLGPCAHRGRNPTACALAFVAAHTRGGIVGMRCAERGARLRHDIGSSSVRCAQDA